LFTGSGKYPVGLDDRGQETHCKAFIVLQLPKQILSAERVARALYHHQQSADEKYRDHDGNHELDQRETTLPFLLAINGDGMHGFHGSTYNV